MAASLEAASLWNQLNPTQKRIWLKLLHYEGASSLIDEKTFFVDPQGDNAPDNELTTFLSLYNSETKKTFGRLKLPLHCAYPARVTFLQRVGLLKKKNIEPCTDFGLWKKEVNPKSVSIVFSTAYPNNPASMFGHTFLRFHSMGKKSDLLDYGANYSALTNGTDNGFMYAMKGIFGGYRGYFDLAPYYIKLNEYLYGENRDLIEYELNLDQHQIDFLLAHLWELYQGASFDYYFTHENCSYHLGKLIEVVLPQDLPTVNRWYYLPTDLIDQIVRRENLVKNILPRPSRFRTVRKSLKGLSPDSGKKVLASYKENRDQTENLQEKKALIKLLNYTKFKVKENFSKQQRKLLRDILLKVSKEKTESLEEMENHYTFLNQPHLAHQPRRIHLGSEYHLNQTVLRVGIRQGYHDLLARDQGLESFSQFRFLGFDIQYYFEDNKVRLRELIVMDIASFFPFTPYEKQISWKVGGRIEDMPEKGNCSNCQRGILEGKIGVAFGDRFHLATILFGGVLETSPVYKRGHKENLAYELILGKSWILPIQGKDSKEIKILTSFEGLHNINYMAEDRRSLVKGGLHYSWTKDWELRLTCEIPLIGKNYQRVGERFGLQIATTF